jgi:uncharacterized protein YjbI with pentapeptide repeats
MANPEHLQLLKRGNTTLMWWRDQNRGIPLDLSEADLAGADLTHYRLSGVNLTYANLTGAYLAGAYLTHADLTGTNLNRALLAGTHLTHAVLSKANLTFTHFSGANLAGADVSEAYLLDTVFRDTNLTAVRGLDTCSHIGPSVLDHRTLAQSGPLPLAFLRGCGLPDALIDYLPSLLNEPFQFYSCFIS